MCSCEWYMPQLTQLADNSIEISLQDAYLNIAFPESFVFPWYENNQAPNLMRDLSKESSGQVRIQMAHLSFFDVIFHLKSAIWKRYS